MPDGPVAAIVSRWTTLPFSQLSRRPIRKGTAHAGKRLLLLAALFVPLPLVLVPGTYRTAALGVSIVVLLAWMLRGRTLRLHGVEHRAIAAAEARCLVDTWHGVARPSRFSPRCGTNFAALLVPVSLLLERVWIVPPTGLTSVFVSVAALTLTNRRCPGRPARGCRRAGNRPKPRLNTRPGLTPSRAGTVESGLGHPAGRPAAAPRWRPSRAPLGRRVATRANSYAGVGSGGIESGHCG